MKILNVYRNIPKEDTKKLAEIVSEGREAESFSVRFQSRLQPIGGHGFRSRQDHLLVVSPKAYTELRFHYNNR